MGFMNALFVLPLAAAAFGMRISCHSAEFYAGRGGSGFVLNGARGATRWAAITSVTRSLRREVIHRHRTFQQSMIPRPTRDPALRHKVASPRPTPAEPNGRPSRSMH